MISVGKCFDTPPTKKNSGTFWHVQSILNVIKYTLIPLTLISEKLVTFHEHHNRKPFLNLIKIACGCYGAYLKIIGILKHVSF